MRRSSRGHSRLQLSSRVDTQILFEAGFHLPIAPPFFVQSLLILLVLLVGCLFFNPIDMHINATVTTSSPGYMQPWGTTDGHVCQGTINIPLGSTFNSIDLHLPRYIINFRNKYS